jgi:hypothetical protein
MRDAPSRKDRSKMALPGLTIVTLTAGAPDFTQDTYAQLVTDTLGNVGADGDDLAVSADALAALMASYEQEVSDGLAAEDVPTFDGAPFDTTVEDAALAALAVADSEEIAINGGLQFLYDFFGAWGDLLTAIASVEADINSVSYNLQGQITGIWDTINGLGCNPFTGGCG